MFVKSKLIFFALFIVTLPLIAQQWTTYTAVDGLAGNQVNSILIDPDGIKWFGTENGLSRFDGISWKTYRQTGAVQTLADNHINDLAYEMGSYGPELWIATDNGVSVMGYEVDAVTFATPYRTDNRDLLSNKVNTVEVDDAHNRFFGTDAGLSLFQDSDWLSFTAPLKISNNDIIAIGVDNVNGWRYLGTSGGGVNRLKMETDGITTASPYDYDWSGLYSNRVNDIFVKENSEQWYATNVGAAYHKEFETKSGWTNLFREDGLGTDTVNVVIEDSKGVAWFGTPTGVAIYNGTDWDRILKSHGLASNHILDIAIDLDGSMWFATDQGVSHMIGTFSNIDESMIPSSFVLHPNYPNPFNPSTIIGFQMKEPGKVMIDVYNIKGQLVHRLLNEFKPIGYHEVVWNGRHDNSQFASAGMYIARMHAVSTNGKWTGSQKMILVK